MKERTFLFPEQSPDSAGSQPESGDTAHCLPTSSGRWSRLVTSLRSWMTIPYGYEDEEGFHLGPQPVPPGLNTLTASNPEVFTDRACDVMKYPTAFPELNFEASAPSTAAKPPGAKA